MFHMEPPYLTDDEIESICRPRKQGAAQIRFLRALGLRVERRPDGSPLVWRADIERRRIEPFAASQLAEPRWGR